MATIEVNHVGGPSMTVTKFLVYCYEEECLADVPEYMRTTDIHGVPRAAVYIVVRRLQA